MFFSVGSSNGKKSESVVEVVVFAVLWADTVQWLAGVRVLGFVSHFLYWILRYFYTEFVVFGHSRGRLRALSHRLREDILGRAGCSH